MSADVGDPSERADLQPTARVDPPARVARCGAELVELSERYYCGVFRGSIILVALASLFALALLPTRKSVPSTLPPLTVVLAALLVALAPLAVRHSTRLYRLMRRHPRTELALVGAAAALAAYPLRSELWWSACGLLMLLATMAPLWRAMAYCLTVLLTNLTAHVVAGDLTTAPPVSIIGLWIGLVFWTLTFGILSERLAALTLHFNTRETKLPVAPTRVHAWVEEEPPASSPSADDGPKSDLTPPADASDGWSDLTARQLQVVALLADGLRYRDIAQCLSISERQVQRHISNASTATRGREHRRACCGRRRCRPCA